MLRFQDKPFCLSTGYRQIINTMRSSLHKTEETFCSAFFKTRFFLLHKETTPVCQRLRLITALRRQRLLFNCEFFVKRPYCQSETKTLIDSVTAIVRLLHTIQRSSRTHSKNSFIMAALPD
jgi:hypothetical protein